MGDYYNTNAISRDDIRDATNFLTALGSTREQPSQKDNIISAVQLLASEAKRLGLRSDSAAGGIPAQNKLFVGQLPVDIRDEEVKMVFDTYGEVVNIHIIDGKPAGTQKVAFVEYKTDEGAATAVEALNDVYKFREDSEQPVKVSVARPKKPKDSGGSGGDWKAKDNGGSSWNSGNDWKSGGKDWDSGGSSGKDWGSSGKDWNSGGSDWNSGGSKDSWQGGGGGGGGYGNSGGGYGGRDYGNSGGGYGKSDDRHAPNPPGPKIYVANLPTDIQEETLRQVFGTYGQIKDIKILAPKTEGSQVSAFIAYENEDDATSAIRAMEIGYEIRPGEGNIKVQYAKEKPRDQRGGCGGGGGGGRYAPY